MRHFSFSSLRTRLITLVLAAIIPWLALTLYEKSEQQQLARGVAEDKALDLAREVSSHHERIIEGAHQLLTALAQIPEVRQLKADQCNALFADILKKFPYYTILGSAKPNGDLYCSGLPFTSPTNFADRPYFQQVLRTPEFTVGQYQIGRISGKVNVALVYPVLGKSDRVEAVIFVGLSLDWLNDVMIRSNLPQGSALTLRDRNGTILARYPDGEKWVGKSFPEGLITKAIIAQQSEGTAVTTGVDGVLRLYAFTRLKGLETHDVYVSVGIPTQVAFAEVNRTFYRDIVLIGIIIFLSLAAATVISDRSISRPVNELVGATKRLAAGDLSARTGVPYGQSEIGQLAQTFDQMAESIQMRRADARRVLEDLRESELKFRSVTESAYDAIISADSGQQIISWNRGAEIIFGYSKEEVLGKPITLLMPERYIEAHRSGVERFISTGKPNVIGKTAELHGLRKGGQEFPLELSLSSWKKEEEMFYSAIIRDTSERKRSEEQSRRKTRELASLHDIDRAITSTLNLPTVLDVLLENIDLHFPYSAATIRLFNSENGLLEPVACHNLNEKEWKAEQWRGGRGTPNIVFESKAPLAVRNVQSDPRMRDPGFFIKYGLVSYLGIPLIVKDLVLGVLSFYTKEEHNFSNEEIDFLSALADQAAIAIHNARLYGDLVTSSEALEKSNKVKDEFLSVMSHELRTPLNVVVGYTGMIKDGLLGEITPQQEEALGKVINRANDQLTLVNNILHATLLESEKINIESHEVGLGDFLNQLRLAYVAPINKELTLDWDYPSDLPVIKTDSGKLKHILQNLIDNAIKFTEKGSITISARIRQQAEGNRQQSPTLTPSASRLILRRAQDDPEQSRRVTPLAFVEFKVADTGVGIPKEHLGAIFEKFRQADSSETRLYGGVGMGLYIVKKFSELLGGTVEVESEPGKGSVFTVTLPLEQ